MKAPKFQWHILRLKREEMELKREEMELQKKINYSHFEWCVCKSVGSCTTLRSSSLTTV